MCGIAGIYQNSIISPKETNKPQVESMLRTMQHRGPDASGTFSFDNICIGHTRLSILDTSSAGNQPMHYKDLSIVFNGEIYNYIELKNDLKILGHEFISSSDTEVILHAFDEWGIESFKKFRGMWAFVIIDKAQNEIVGCRDFFGIKPFYYYKDKNSFFFASEIKALLNIPEIHPKVNMSILMDYLIMGFSEHTSATFFDKIDQLLPAHYFKLDLKNNTIKIEKFYELRESLENTKSSETEFETYFSNSIEHHLRSDVPVGTCLSGGVDSSSIAAMASRKYRSNQKNEFFFKAITAQSEEKSQDETYYAELVTKNNPIDWHKINPDYDDFRNEIEDCLYFQEEPVGTPSVFMQYMVMKKAKNLGLKVLLDGQGGDEILLGYERYYPAFFVYLFKSMRFFKLISEFINCLRYSKLNLFTLTAYFFYFLFPKIRKKYLKKRFFFVQQTYLDKGFTFLKLSSKGFFDINKLQVSEIESLQLPHLLRYEDKNSMAHSIEARTPFVDKKIVEFCLNLPHHSKINNGYTKFPLRKLLRKLTCHEVAWRRNKIGFESPTSKWMKQHESIAKNLISKSKILSIILKPNTNYISLSPDIQWKLYNIAVWEKQFSVSI